jgi:hypothetical protein
LLWPSLRASLFAHTFSLHAQAKVRSDLQLHFAPRAAQSYFSRVPKQCHMSKRTGASHNVNAERWISELSEDLRSGRPRDSYIDGLNRYGHLLGSDPSAVRNLFALRDLADRQSQTPTAAIGILDIIDSLEPAANHAVKEKQLALSAAVESALTADASSSLHCLALVDARLRRPSFSNAGSEVVHKLKDSVEKIVAREPFALMSTCGQSSPLDDSAFWQGVAEGLRIVAETHPDGLESLGRHPNIAMFVVRESPSIASAYLLVTRNRASESNSEVAEWVRHIERIEQRHRVRSELLPLVSDDANVPLLEELLRDISEAEVESILDVLAESTRGFARASLRRVVTDFISQRFPEETIRWGKRPGLLQAGQIADVVVEAFPLSTEGLERIQATDWKSHCDRCEVWSAFVERSASKQLPQWFVRRAGEDVAIIEPYSTCTPLSARAMRALRTIGDQCEYLPVVRSSLFDAFASQTELSGLADILAPKAIDSALVEHFSGRIDDNRLSFALSVKSCQELYEQVAGNHLHSLLISTNNRDDWERAWTTLSLLPNALFRKVASHRIITDFARSYRAYWSESVARAWSSIVVRAHEELPYDAALRLHMESTAFCLNNPRLPVGQVVLAAFPLVYDAVAMAKAPLVTDEMFGYFDWDKAKRLRKNVIDSFVSSCWPPEDLAILASKCQILRKVIHRLQRKWGGDEYIRRILEGLRQCEAPEAVSVASEMSAIVHDPDFFEPWD